jgi:hypothetical protein
MDLDANSQPISPDSAIYGGNCNLSQAEMAEFEQEDPSYLTYMLYYKTLI